MNSHFLLKANIPSNDTEFSLLAKKLDKIVRQVAKGFNCLVCGKEVSSFCNSHTIPAFMLKYISINGEVKSHGDLVFSPLDKGYKGVKQAGTFRIICRECDSIMFQNYECENNYSNINMIKTLLSEIALKTTLRVTFKRIHEMGIFYMTETSSQYASFINQILRGKVLDLIELKKDFDFIQNNKKNLNAFKILFHKRLRYRVPIAVQDMINLTCDFKGKPLNNIYDFNKDNRLEPFYICVFPLENESHIIIFTKKTVKKYNQLFYTLKKMKLSEQLKIINYLIFDNLEDYFIRPDIDISTLKELASKVPIIAGPSPINHTDSIKLNNKDYFSSKNWESLLNLLEEQNKPVL